MKAKTRELLMELKRLIANQDPEISRIQQHYIDMINEIIFEMDKEDRNKNKNNENNC